MSKIAKKIYDITGENVYLCYFCGKCGASCPMAEYMDYKPYQVIHMIQLGDEEVFRAESIWYCASCFTCSVKCPRGIDIAKVMEGVRLILLRERKDAVDLRRVEDLERYPPIALVAASRKYTG